MKSYIIAILISICLFVIPFFWLPKGFVDLGGDSGRLYFLDPASFFQHIYASQTPAGVIWYSILPYVGYVYILKHLAGSVTNLIAIDHGIQLSLAFLFTFLAIRTLLSEYIKKHTPVTDWVAAVSGFVYTAFATKSGWGISLIAQNQIFESSYVLSTP